MKSIIQKLYNLYMEENDRTDIERLRTQGDDLCKKKREDAYQSYQKLRSRLTGDLAEELDILARILIDVFDDVHSSGEHSERKTETRSAL